MGLTPNKVIEVCNSRYQQIYGNYNANSDKKIVLSHFGELSQELVNSLSNKLEEMMAEAGDKKGTIKRVFSILIEGLQNIRLHGEKDEDGNQASFLVIAEDSEEYLITTGNLILNKNRETIEATLEEINSLNEAQIKEKYMEVMTNGIMSNKGGAGLGIITMAMKSKNVMKYFFDPINNDLTVFTLEVKVNRQ